MYLKGTLYFLGVSGLKLRREKKSPTPKSFSQWTGIRKKQHVSSLSETGTIQPTIQLSEMCMYFITLHPTVYKSCFCLHKICILLHWTETVLHNYNKEALPHFLTQLPDSTDLFTFQQQHKQLLLLGATPLSIRPSL